MCDAAKLSRLCDAQSLQSCVIDAPFIAGVLGSLPSESIIFARLSCDVMSTGSRRIVLGTTGARGKTAGRPPTSMHGAVAARRASSMRSVGHAGGLIVGVCASRELGTVGMITSSHVIRRHDNLAEFCASQAWP